MLSVGVWQDGGVQSRHLNDPAPLQESLCVEIIFFCCCGLWWERIEICICGFREGQCHDQQILFDVCLRKHSCLRDEAKRLSSLCGGGGCLLAHCASYLPRKSDVWSRPTHSRAIFHIDLLRWVTCWTVQNESWRRWNLAVKAKIPSSSSPLHMEGRLSSFLSPTDLHSTVN